MRTAFCCVAKLSLTLATSPSDHRKPVAHADRQRLELVDGLRAGVQLDVELALADARDAGGHDHVGGLQRADHVHLRQPLGAELGRVDVDDDLALLAAVGRRDRQARDGEQPGAQEVEAVVEDLLLGTGLAVERDLHHRHVRGVEPDHVRRRDAGRRDAQDRIVLRVDLRDGAADVGALREIDLEDAEPGDRQRFDALDAVHRRRIGALADEHDAALHVLGGQAGIVPGDVDHRDVDVGEDVDDHPLRGQEAHHQDEHSGDGHGVWPAQREAHESDHSKSIPNRTRTTFERLPPRSSSLCRRCRNCGRQVVFCFRE